MGYEDTRQKIISTLMQRPNNTEIQPGAHQDFALSLLEYIRSVELISGSTLIGVAEEDTMPVQSNIGNESYIAGVPSQSVIVYKNFINKYGEPISVITENESKFVILFWNKQYWEKQEISISVSNIDTSKFATAEQGAKADTATTEIDALKKTVKTIEDSVVDIESFDFIPFAGLSTILIEDIIQRGASSTIGEVFFNVTTQTFIYLSDGSYYAEWLNGKDYGVASLYGHSPKKNAVYYTKSALYEWNGSALNEIFNRGEGSVSNIEAEAPLAQKNGKLSLNIGDGLKVENDKLVAIPQSSSDTSSSLRALFVAAGAEYNDTGVDIVKTTPWAEYVDEVDFKAENNIDVLNYTTVNLHSIVQDGTTYQYVIDNGVFKVVGRATKGQIIHDERYCVHRAGHYYLNGLGDITEKQMMLIYNRTAIPFNKYISYFRMQNESDLPYIPRTNILSDAFFAGNIFENLNSAFYASTIEVFKASGSNNRNFALIPEFEVATLGGTFERSQMKYLIGALNIKKQSTTNTQYIGGNAPNLRVLLFKNLCGNLKTFNAASKISKSSILYAINNSIATTAITITLHPTAYARFKDDPEVVAALESKPLVTLVSEI